MKYNLRTHPITGEVRHEPFLYTWETEHSAMRLDPNISASDQIFYQAFYLRYGGIQADPNKDLYKRQEDISVDLKVSLRQVKEHLKRLKLAGWILSQRQADHEGRCVYYICETPFKVAEHYLARWESLGSKAEREKISQARTSGFRNNTEAYDGTLGRSDDTARIG